MNSYRHIYAPPSAGAGRRSIWVEVVARDQLLYGPFVSQQGVPAYRIMIFHGGVRLQRKGKWRRWEGDQLVVFNPDEPCAYEGLGGCLLHSWIRVNGVAVDMLLPAELRKREGDPIALKNGTEGLLWLDRIVEELDGYPWQDNVQIECLIQLWLRSMLRELGSTKVDDTQWKARRYIESNYLNHPSLSQVAVAAGVSKEYLCVRYKQTFEVTPHADIVRLCMEFAREHLGNRSLRIGEVASLAGYEDPYYFSKCFKMAFGMSPMEYRKRG